MIPLAAGIDVLSAGTVFKGTRLPGAVLTCSLWVPVPGFQTDLAGFFTNGRDCLKRDTCTFLTLAGGSFAPGTGLGDRMTLALAGRSAVLLAMTLFTLLILFIVKTCRRTAVGAIRTILGEAVAKVFLVTTVAPLTYTLRYTVVTLTRVMLTLVTFTL